jgi:CelD/BcsL family acetyltransferase involved in cellulose biosynthesis
VATRILDIRRIQSTAEVVPFLEGWRQLAGDAPMRSPEWLLGWWENYARPKDELFILLALEPGGQVVGIAPLYLRHAANGRAIRLLGDGEGATDHGNWLVADGWDVQVGIEVGRFLLATKGHWQRLVLESIDTDATAIQATVEHLGENGCHWHRRQINSCWKIRLPATWEEYLGMLGKSLRKRVRKLQREYFDSGRIRVRQAQTEAELAEGFEILLKLHAARWGNAGAPLGVFSSTRFSAFHRRMSAAFLKQNKLRLAWLECDGAPIAVEYQFVDAKTIYAYQAGLDLAMDDFSPGKLTMMASIRDAIERGCEYFDLLRGDEPYKANWRALPSPCYDLRVWPKPGLGWIEWGLWSGHALAARQLKPRIPARRIEEGLRLCRRLLEACLLPALMALGDLLAEGLLLYALS